MLWILEILVIWCQEVGRINIDEQNASTFDHNGKITPLDPSNSAVDQDHPQSVFICSSGKAGLANWLVVGMSVGWCWTSFNWDCLWPLWAVFIKPFLNLTNPNNLNTAGALRQCLAYNLNKNKNSITLQSLEDAQSKIHFGNGSVTAVGH